MEPHREGEKRKSTDRGKDVGYVRDVNWINTRRRIIVPQSHCVGSGVCKNGQVSDEDSTGRRGQEGEKGGKRKPTYLGLLTVHRRGGQGR
jgi:hypothetical protein